LVAAQKIDELLAGDSVTYDDMEGAENEEPGDVDDNNDSVATDASGDADELNVGNFVSAPVFLGEFIIEHYNFNRFHIIRLVARLQQSTIRPSPVYHTS
jgi:hypothetical protein